MCRLHVYLQAGSLDDDAVIESLSDRDLVLTQSLRAMVGSLNITDDVQDRQAIEVVDVVVCDPPLQSWGSFRHGDVCMMRNDVQCENDSMSALSCVYICGFSRVRMTSSFCFWYRNIERFLPSDGSVCFRVGSTVEGMYTDTGNDRGVFRFDDCRGARLYSAHRLVHKCHVFMSTDEVENLSIPSEYIRIIPPVYGSRINVNYSTAHTVAEERASVSAACNILSLPERTIDAVLATRRSVCLVADDQKKSVHRSTDDDKSVHIGTDDEERVHRGTGESSHREIDHLGTDDDKSPEPYIDVDVARTADMIDDTVISERRRFQILQLEKRRKGITDDIFMPDNMAFVGVGGRHGYRRLGDARVFCSDHFDMCDHVVGCLQAGHSVVLCTEFKFDGQYFFPVGVVDNPSPNWYENEHIVDITWIEDTSLPTCMQLIRRTMGCLEVGFPLHLFPFTIVTREQECTINNVTFKVDNDNHVHIIR
jgi:hypothetical protein